MAQFNTIEHGPYVGYVVGGDLNGYHIENATPHFVHALPRPMPLDPDDITDHSLAEVRKEEYNWHDGTWYLIEKG